jgi:hypothetical protein
MACAFWPTKTNSPNDNGSEGCQEKDWIRIGRPPFSVWLHRRETYECDMRDFEWPNANSIDIVHATLCRLTIQLPLRSTYSPLCRRAGTLSSRSRSIAPQWWWRTDRQSSSIPTWRAVHYSIFHIALCKIYSRRSSVSCRVHHIRLWKLGWEIISFNWPRALHLRFGATGPRTTRRINIARHGAQITRSNLERR